MASMFATIYNSLTLGNVVLLLLLLFLLHYLMVLYEFRSMPPGPRLTTLPVLGNIFSLDFKADKFTDAFQRSVSGKARANLVGWKIFRRLLMPTCFENRYICNIRCRVSTMFLRKRLSNLLNTLLSAIIMHGCPSK